jgi:O-antigen ligase
MTLIGTSLFAVYLADRFSTRSLLRLLTATMLVIGCLSVVFAVAWPAYGIDELRDGAWRGIFTTKNELGRAMALGAALSALRASYRSWDGVLWQLIGIGFFGLVVASESATSIAVTIGLVAALWTARIARKVGGSGAIVLMLVGATGPTMAVWLVGNREAVAGILGRDVTFSGRTLLWDAVWRMILERPWLGNGYGSFWRGWDGPSAEVWRAINFDAPHSHNGFLDLWLELGLIGVALLIGPLVNTAIKVFRNLRHDPEVTDLALVILVSLLLFNLTESSLLGRTSVFWIVTFTMMMKVQDLSRLYQGSERNQRR